ncbi:cyclin-D3-1-like [Primulina tabacum]|uniref:cyclin-D3-1-like n=1 Tax=Primulina tabacum TaxID=48773 RepID=UPI003F5AB83E
MSFHQLNPLSTIDSLHCEEEHWDCNEEIIENNARSYFFIAEEGVGDSDLDKDNNKLINSESFVGFLEQKSLGEDEELKCLLAKEKGNEVCGGFEPSPSRGEAVEWILKVTGYYSFSALTAVLAVNYLDRFLYSFQSHREKPWMTQLVAVACLSLAAKVEETQVPLLLDLQVEEAKYVFESKTIQRMELLVLSTLQWKMNPVTPHSFLDYISRNLGLKSSFSKDVLRRSECLLLSIISDCRAVCHLPSALATATMLYVINSVEPTIGVQYQDHLINILGTNKEKVEDCCRFIQDVATSVHFCSSNKRKFRSSPCSPNGVLEVSLGSESSNDSWAVKSIASASSSPEPLSKKTKSQSQNHAIF